MTAGPPPPAPPPAPPASGFFRDGGIPVRQHTYGALELFLFSAATWNPHRVHYDQDYTREVTGEPALLVQGPLQAAHMFRLLRETLAEGVAVRSLEYRHQAVLHAGEPARITGRLVSADGTGATVEMWVESGRTGQRTTTGVAHLERQRAAPPTQPQVQEAP